MDWGPPGRLREAMELGHVSFYENDLVAVRLVHPSVETRLNRGSQLTPRFEERLFRIVRDSSRSLSVSPVGSFRELTPEQRAAAKGAGF